MKFVLKEIIIFIALLISQCAAQQITIEISELMYRIPPSEDFPLTTLQWIELRNVGFAPLNMSKVKFTEGILMDLSEIGTLEVGQFVVVSNNPEAFKDRYGKPPSILKPWNGTLQTQGDGSRVILSRFLGKNDYEIELASLKYGTAAPWSALAATAAFSLVPTVVLPAETHRDTLDRLSIYAHFWRASDKRYGTPFEVDAGERRQSVPLVYFSEIYPHTDPPDVDQLELYNAEDEDVDIGGWSITDSPLSDPRLYVLPRPFVIKARSYRMISEVSLGFGLSSAGEDLYLFAYDSLGERLPYEDAIEFPATLNSRSQGRYVNTGGEVTWLMTKKKCEQVLDCGLTAGEANTEPDFGPLLVHRILYRAADDASGNERVEDEFVDVINAGDASVTLRDAGARGTDTSLCACFYIGGGQFDALSAPSLLADMLGNNEAALFSVVDTRFFVSRLSTMSSETEPLLFVQFNGTAEADAAILLVSAPYRAVTEAIYDNEYRLRGSVDYEFALDTVMAPGDVIRVVGDDPEAYRTRNAGLLPPDVVSVVGPFRGTLSNRDGRVELKRPDEQDIDGNVPQLRMDYVHYVDREPWPKQVDNAPIERVSAALMGNEPTNWLVGDVIADAAALRIDARQLALLLVVAVLVGPFNT